LCFSTQMSCVIHVKCWHTRCCFIWSGAMYMSELFLDVMLMCIVYNREAAMWLCTHTVLRFVPRNNASKFQTYRCENSDHVPRIVRKNGTRAKLVEESSEIDIPSYGTVKGRWCHYFISFLYLFFVPYFWHKTSQ
jgi:hypothetical protein